MVGFGSSGENLVCSNVSLRNNCEIIANIFIGSLVGLMAVILKAYLAASVSLSSSQRCLVSVRLSWSDVDRSWLHLLSCIHKPLNGRHDTVKNRQAEFF